MALVFKMIKDGQGENIFEFRTNQNGARTAGDNSAWTHNTGRKYSFAVRVIEPWNQLPDSIK